MRSLRCTAAWVVLIAASLLPADPASGMSYVMMSDEALLDRARVVAVVEVVQPLPLQRRSDGYVVETRYLVRTLHAVKGRPPAQFVVQLPGAPRGVAPALHVPGVPSFAAGDTVLWFLARTEEGYVPADLALGTFRRVHEAGEAWYVRDLSDARAIGKRTGDRYDRPRRADAFVHWLAARARGERLPEDYFAPASSAKFNLLQFNLAGTDYRVRWFRFDTGQTVAWYALQGGQDGMVTDEFQQLQQALAAWTNDPASNVLYTYAGTVASDNGITPPADGKSTVLWNDPGNDLTGSYDCEQGGLLGYSSWFLVAAPRAFQGVDYLEIAESFVIVQDGAACILDENGGANGAAMLAHELGHSLGLAHACGGTAGPPCGVFEPFDDALMAPALHQDGRGARLSDDDRAGILLLYPDANKVYANGFETPP